MLNHLPIFYPPNSTNSEFAKILFHQKFVSYGNITLPSQPFLGRHTPFFTMAFLGPHTFFTAGLFWIRFRNCILCSYHIAVIKYLLLFVVFSFCIGIQIDNYICWYNFPLDHFIIINLADWMAFNLAELSTGWFLTRWTQNFNLTKPFILDDFWLT